MATAERQSPERQASAKPMAFWVELTLLALILLAAGWLRMANPGLTEFKADEGRLLAAALDMVDGQFALRGLSSSVGFPNFPASVWLYALPLFFWPHPYAATLFTGLLNTMAVAGTYWLVRRYWGISAAMAATLMLAVSPWAVIFSRKIWAQNLLPLFVLGWAVGAVLALVEERPKFIWLNLICLAIAVQIHLAAVALVPATALILLIFWRRIHWRSLLVGLLLAALTVVPFAIYLGQTWEEVTLLEEIASSSSTALTAESLYYTSMISLGSDIHSLAGIQAYQLFLDRLPPMSAVYLVWGLLILAGVGILTGQVWKNWAKPASQVGLIILIWLFAPALFFLLHSTPVFLHYFIATFAAQYIAAGVAFAAVLNLIGRRLKSKRSGRWLSTAAWAVLLVTAVAQGWAVVSLNNFLGSTATPGAFGVPLAMKLQVAGTARSLLSENEAAEIIVAGAGESVRIDSFPAEWDVLLRDTPHRFVDVNQSALFPANPAVVLLDSREKSASWTGDLYLQAGSTTQEIPLRPGEGNYTIIVLPGGAKPQPEFPVDPPYLLANWVNLLGHDQLRRIDDETGLWQIHWRTGDNPDPANYQFFNHLLDQHEQRISQVDQPAFSPGQWAKGDMLISRFLIPWPENGSEPAAMRVGMYTYPALENIPLLDVAGNPYLDAATFLLDNDAISHDN